MLGVESEIAKRIAESLQAKLTGREEEALAVKPTNNPEAYDAYLRGLAFEIRSMSGSLPSSSSRGLEEKATSFYERAVQLDSNLRSLGRGSLAWTRVSTSIAAPMLLGATQRSVLWRKRRNCNRTRLKPCSPWVIINTKCSVITGPPEPRSVASAKRYQAAVRC